MIDVNIDEAENFLIDDIGRVSGGHVQQHEPDSSPIHFSANVDLPAPPDLSQLPLPILHSGTVETLLGLNEDMLARLTTNIRRYSAIEGQLIQTAQERDLLAHQNSSLSAQMEVLKEKERSARERMIRAETSHIGLLDDIGMLRKKILNLENSNQTLRASHRFQRRVRAWVRPMIDQLSARLEAEKKSVLAQEAKISDLRTRLNETIQHAQELEGHFTKDQARLVEQYEKACESLQNENEKLNLENRNLREKADHMTRAFAAEARSQNKIVELERRIQHLSKELAETRRELREKNDELTRSQCDKSSESIEQLSDQFESLKKVWADTERRLRQSEERNETLNRLNQELSRQMNELTAKPLSPEGQS